MSEATTRGEAHGRAQAFYEHEASRASVWTTPKRGHLYFKEVLRYERLLPMVPREAASVLDLGCGDGYLSVLLARRGHEVTAVDLARARLDKFADKAHELGIVRLQASATGTGLEDASFDALVSSEVLEHLPEPEAMLVEARRLLRPGGTLVMCVPNDETIRQVTCPHCERPFSPDGHLHSFTKETLAGLVAGAGFEVTAVRTFRNKRTEKVKQGIVHLPYGAWVRGVDAAFSKLWPELDQYLAVAARRPPD